MKVNRALIKPKLLYFLFMSIVSSLLIYCNMFLVQKGLNEAEIGVIDTVCYVTGFLLRPICGLLADRYHAYRSVLLTLMLFTALGFDSMLLLPPQPLPATVNLTVIDFGRNTSQLCRADQSVGYHGNGSLVAMPESLCQCGGRSEPVDTRLDLTERLSDRCAVYGWTWENDTGGGAEMRLSRLLLNGSLSCAACGRGDDAPIVSWSATFLLALLLKTIGLSAYSPLLCLLDAVTFSLLGAKHSQYGRTRLFGSVGFFVTALITGFALYGYSAAWSFTTDYTASFLLATGLLAASGAVTLMLKVPASTRTMNPLKALPMLCASWRVGAFFALVLMAGASFGVFETFLSVIVLKMLNPPLYYFGILFAVQVLVEAPLFFVSGPIVARIGEPACLVIGFLAFSLRFLLTSLVNSTWLLLLVNCLHGLSFGLMFPAMLMLAARQAPDGWQGTVQGLVSGLYFGVGQALSAPTTGAGIRLWGGRAALRVWAGLSLGFAGLALAHLLALRRWPGEAATAATTSVAVALDSAVVVEGKVLADGAAVPQPDDPVATAAVALLSQPD